MKKPAKKPTPQRLEAEDKKFLWHPFTQMQEWESETPVIIREGQGVYLTDIHGQHYLDGTSSIWLNLHGHRRREIDRAITAQLNRIAHSTLLGLSNIPSIELARELIAIAPKGLKRVFYSDNGSTAVEIALKMALQFWQLKSRPRKNKVLHFVNAYHGDTVGSMSVGGMDIFHKRFAPFLFDTAEAQYPYCYRCPLSLTYPECQIACLDEAAQIIRQHHSRLAALILEPGIQAAAGMLISPPGFLKRIRQLCDQYEVLLILDEVATGFGRTGKMFACQHEGVTPDLMTVAKGLTGGYLPLAATLTTAEIYNTFLGKYSEFKTFFHGHSYTGNPLGCAAALASLRIFKKQKLLSRIRVKSRHLARLLRPFSGMEHVGEIRQIGLMVGIELVRDRAEKKPYLLTERKGLEVAHEARKRGMLIRPLGNVVVFMPPLVTSKRLLERMIRILRESILQATSQKP